MGLVARHEARTFLDTPIDGRHVHHKNENTGDNCVENLDILTPADHAAKHHDNVLAMQAASARNGRKKVVATVVEAYIPWCKYGSTTGCQCIGECKAIGFSTLLSNAPIGELESYNSHTEAAQAMRVSTASICSVLDTSSVRCGRTWRSECEAPNDIAGETWKTLDNMGRRNPRNYVILYVSNMGRLEITRGRTKTSKRGYGMMNNGSLMTTSNAAVAYVNNQRASEAGVQTLKSTVSVHELVARLFVGPPPQSLPRYALQGDRFVVHHKNGNHLDNCAANLLWILNSMHTRVHRLGMSYAETLATFEIDKQTHVQLAAQMEISPEEQEEQDEEARVEIAREILRKEQEVWSRCSGRWRSPRAWRMRGCRVVLARHTCSRQQHGSRSVRVG